MITLVSYPTFYGSRVGLLVGIIRQDGGREEWTSGFGLGGDRQLFLSPLSSRLRFDKAVVGPPTNHWVSAPKTPALQLHHFERHSSFSSTILGTTWG